MKRVITTTLALSLAFVVSCQRAGRPERADRNSPPARLTTDQIDESINAGLKRKPDDREAGIALKKALKALDPASSEPIHKAVYWFKVAKAHGQTLTGEEEKQFVDASRKLTKQVQEKYSTACDLEADKKYADAIQRFRELMHMLPILGGGNEKDELRASIMAHLAHNTALSKKSK